MTMDRATLLALWRMMARIRAFEDQLIHENAQGGIDGHLHLYHGQEAIAAGLCAHLGDDDHIASTHRGHGHALAKGCDPHQMMAEIMGRETGLCGGKGGSMHLADLKRGHLGSNGIVGANVPLALGAALSAKSRGLRAVSMAFIGDGAANQGAVFESMNLAAALALPMIFVIEDNDYGEYTASRSVTGCTDLAARTASFGMNAARVDGCDVLAVYHAASDAIRAARCGKGPATLVARAPRLGGHYEGDDQAYRHGDQLADCLSLFHDHLCANHGISAQDLDALRQQAKNEMKAAALAARADAPPPPEALLADVTAGDEEKP
ncbi:MULTISPECIES: thiamine pyrophosphate-dependent dehydrogenase E1 component subunit alpha [unclassified Iodidimonas]|jgi:pyruvate dehydrogenase E1 component alpha subunit|uniref:thiamine pyrophosphate-dependent dehydrogenase E1 component subunit alpha n=1 Tax=unclassified Iodidimonas TaxID=2626145 RepID=UPI002482495B|nr:MULTISPECIES: thiamine pyrophosphate-dependent dehydrogenase E1 component subunit alpha [unclassified Iodidimonas]